MHKGLALPRLLLGYGIGRASAGEISEGLEALREAEALTGELDDPSLSLELDLWIGWAFRSRIRVVFVTLPA
ncbi:MAG: hypothetical protein V3V67_01770 [Myxococcota bacterium]